MTKSKSIDQLQLAVLKEELSLKKEMLSEITQADKEYQQTMVKFATTMENLSHSVSNAFGMMSVLLTRPGPSYLQQSSRVPQESFHGDRGNYSRHSNDVVCGQLFDLTQL